MSASGDASTGIHYQSSLQFPFSGRELRSLADQHAAHAATRLARLGAAGGSPRVARRRLDDGKLRVCYIGALSDEPQLRAMMPFFGSLPEITAVGSLAFFPLTK